MNYGIVAKPKPDVDVMKILGINLANARGRRTQQEIAVASKVDISTISDIENGQRNPSIATISRIAAAVGVEVEELFRTSGARSTPPTPDRLGVLEAQVADLEKKMVTALAMGTSALERVRHLPPQEALSDLP